MKSRFLGESGWLFGRVRPAGLHQRRRRRGAPHCRPRRIDRRARGRNPRSQDRRGCEPARPRPVRPDGALFSCRSRRRTASASRPHQRRVATDSFSRREVSRGHLRRARSLTTLGVLVSSRRVVALSGQPGGQRRASRQFPLALGRVAPVGDLDSRFSGQSWSWCCDAGSRFGVSCCWSSGARCRSSSWPPGPGS